MFSLQNLQHSGKKQEFHKNTEELDETSSEDDSDDSERQGKESYLTKRGENKTVKRKTYQLINFKVSLA